MEERLFNIHDFFVLMALVQAGVLVILRFVIPGQGRLANGLLFAFLLVFSLELLTDLLLWNEALRLPEYVRQSILPYWFGFSHFARGPLFYFYVCSLIYDQVDFSVKRVWHALPVIVVVILIAAFGVSADDLRSQTNNAQIRLLVSGFWYASNGLSFAYAVWALLCLRSYTQRLKGQFSSISQYGVGWLALISVCFMLSWSWSLIVGICADWGGPLLADEVGTAHNFVRFLIINGLLLYSVVYAGRLMRIAPDEPETEVTSIPVQVVEAIMAGVNAQKLHLQPAITIEEFASGIGLPARLVSQALNQSLGCHFFDFINLHRVEEAKLMLADPLANSMSILDILLASGFNNKSSFHRFFNKIVGMAPSQYRRSMQVQ